MIPKSINELKIRQDAIIARFASLAVKRNDLAALQKLADLEILLEDLNPQLAELHDHIGKVSLEIEKVLKNNNYIPFEILFEMADFTRISSLKNWLKQA